MIRICLITLWTSINVLSPSELFGKTTSSVDIKVLIASGDKSYLQSKIKALRFVGRNIKIQGRTIPSVEGNYFFSLAKPLTIGKYMYKGRFLLIKDKKKRDKYLLILSLPMEKYLGGVLEGEISHSWPLESMKVQAIAARTYAYWIIKNNSNKRYHVKSDTSHQVFKGSEGVNSNFKKALNATQGIILTYKKNSRSIRSPIQTFFTAACGGETEKPYYVWNSLEKNPSFQSIRCNYCITHPKYNWTLKASTKKMSQKLRSRLANMGTIKSIRVVKRSPSRRVLTIEISDGRKKYQLPGNIFRLALGGTHVLSLRFKIKKRGKSYLFTGTGYGHGVGLCQWGAKTMAEKGYSHHRILKYYYKQAKLQKI